jgi:hypothetical protein
MARDYFLILSAAEKKSIAPNNISIIIYPYTNIGQDEGAQIKLQAIAFRPLLHYISSAENTCGGRPDCRAIKASARGFDAMHADGLR